MRALTPFGFVVVTCSLAGCGSSSDGGAAPPAGSSGAGGSSATGGSSAAGGSGAAGAGAKAGSAQGGGAGGGASGSGGASPSGGAGAGGAAAMGGASAAGSGGFTVVVTIVLENHDYAEIVGSPDAPYINSLIAGGALATNYLDAGTHPSLPNYLYMISGQTLVAADVSPTSSGFPKDVDNLGHQLTQKGIVWGAYQESMGAACGLKSKGNYAPKHNPFVYFANVQNDPSCATVDVDYGQFGADLAAGTHAFMWITPNLLSDGHDPTSDPVKGLKNSDAWMAQEVPKILDSAIFKAGGVLFVTWDEAEGRNGDSADQVPMIVVSPKVKPGTKSATAFTHASYLATIEDLYGLPRLGAAASAKNLFELFP